MRDCMCVEHLTKDVPITDNVRLDKKWVIRKLIPSLSGKNMTLTSHAP